MKDPRIETDPDFICSPKHGNSLKRFLEDNPDGASDGVIGRLLKMTEKEVQETYIRAIIKLRKAMGVDE